MHKLLVNSPSSTGTVVVVFLNRHFVCCSYFRNESFYFVYFKVELFEGVCYHRIFVPDCSLSSGVIMFLLLLPSRRPPFYLFNIPRKCFSAIFGRLYFDRMCEISHFRSLETLSKQSNTSIIWLKCKSIQSRSYPYARDMIRYQFVQCVNLTGNTATPLLLFSAPRYGWTALVFSVLIILNRVLITANLWKN